MEKCREEQLQKYMVMMLFLIIYLGRLKLNEFESNYTNIPTASIS